MRRFSEFVKMAFMFERFTECARHAIFYARYEAGISGAAKIEPDHLLLGLIRADPRIRETLGEAREAAARFRTPIVETDVEALRLKVIPLSPASKRALAYLHSTGGEIDGAQLLSALLREDAAGPDNLH